MVDASAPYKGGALIISSQVQVAVMRHKNCKTDIGRHVCQANVAPHSPSTEYGIEIFRIPNAIECQF
jgi:hypothetical protein